MKPAAEKIRVFVSYDREHDADLHDRLVEQAARAASGFRICARSRARRSNGADAGLRREIREADEVIVLCGEHTDCCEPVGAELRIAQEEKRPYFLLWGRHERMCTKPASARPADGMYRWTWEILQDKLLIARRTARSTERLTGLSRMKTGAKDPQPHRPR